MSLETLRSKHAALVPVFTERSRRLWAATEARALGYGGVTQVARATGISASTIRRGLRELRATLDAHADESPEARVTRLRTQRDELTGDIATLDMDEGRLRTALKEVRVSRELASAGALDASVTALEGALADLRTRSVPLHDALTRVNAELTDAQRAVGRQVAHAAEAKLRAIVQEMLPLLTKLEILNARLKAERTLAGRGPLPFSLLSEWVRRAEAFVGTSGRKVTPR